MSPRDPATTCIGVISDTHGLLRPEALQTLAGVDLIVHAGDIGGIEVLERLGALAPVTAVRGNTDLGEELRHLPQTAVVQVEDFSLYLLHDLQQLDLDPAAAGFRAVITGHTHFPRARRRDGVLYLNPGSAGRKRFDSPATLALLRIRDGQPEVEFVDLEKPLK